MRRPLWLTGAVLVVVSALVAAQSVTVTPPSRLIAYGEMFACENNTATALAITNVYHAIHAIWSTGTTLRGVTYTAGKTGPIASVAEGTADDGKVTVTDVAHGLLTGDYITISNSTDYDGQFVVTRLTADTFEIAETWTETRTGTWIMGDYLRVAEAGVYRIDWSASAQSASSTVENYKIEPVHNLTDIDEAASESTINNGAGISVFGGGAIHTFAAGDRVWLKLKQATAGNDNITLTHANLRVSSIGR